MSAFHALVSIIAFGIQSLSAGVLSADAPMSQSFDAKGVRIHYLTAGKGQQIAVPVKILIGDQDPTKRSVVALQQVRKDWPVVVIEGAGHITCVLKPQFREEIAHWVRKNTSK